MGRGGEVWWLVRDVERGESDTKGISTYFHSRDALSREVACIWREKRRSVSVQAKG